MSPRWRSRTNWLGSSGPSGHGNAPMRRSRCQSGGNRPALVFLENCTELDPRMAHRSDRRGANPIKHLACQVVVAVGTPRASFHDGPALTRLHREAEDTSAV